jgi:hypothetical protein
MIISYAGHGKAGQGLARQGEAGLGKARLGNLLSLAWPGAARLGAAE